MVMYLACDTFMENHLTTLDNIFFLRLMPDKCIVLRIGTLTGCPLCRESHPLCRLKNPTVISIWLLVGFHPATRSVQKTPADNTRKRVWQYIEKKRKKDNQGHSGHLIVYSTTKETHLSLFGAILEK